MDFRVEEMSEQRIAYIRKTGPYGIGNKELMDSLKAWADANGLFQSPTVILGIAWDDPASTLPSKCRYDACICVKEDFRIPDESVQEAELPGGRYAVFTLAHAAEALQEAWGGIFPDLSALGYMADEARPILERYAPDMLEKHLCEICVPVK